METIKFRKCNQLNENDLADRIIFNKWCLIINGD
jgi:hypothetical protein